MSLASGIAARPTGRTAAAAFRRPGRRRGAGVAAQAVVVAAPVPGEIAGLVARMPGTGRVDVEAAGLGVFEEARGEDGRQGIGRLHDGLGVGN